jgi:kumamolisin
MPSLKPLFLIIFGTLAFLTAGRSTPLWAAVDAAHVVREGSIHPVEDAAATGAVNPHKAFITRRQLQASETDAPIEFEVALKMRNLPELQTRVAAGERISATEVAAKYNPTAADYDKVTQWLTKAGFTITRQDTNHLALFVRGKISRVQDEMQVSFARVSYEGTEYTSAITAPSVPADLSPLIVGINGLQPHIRMHKHFIVRPSSLTGTNAPYLPSQIAQAYNANTLYSSSITGTGQAIAIVIDTFPAASDLTSFWSTYGVNQSINNVKFIQVVPGTLPPAEGEETLDTEWSSSIAPGAQVRVYAAQSLAFNNLDQTYQQIYSDVTNHPEYNIHQMSMSYGIGEQYTTDSQVQTDSQYFAELASVGVTVFASSGDSGATPGPYGAGDESGPLQVSSPASDPNVTAVGGTALTLNSSGAASSETVWNNASGASGGGASIYFNRPYWQTGNGVASGSARLVPDVASAADPYTGAVLILGGQQVVIGGTSWSSPTWAGFCALINQDRTNHSLAAIGLLGPYLYPFIGTSAFRDVTSGSNATGSGGYNAGVGYDETTGVGVPNVQVLAQSLLTYSPVTPRSPAITNGPPPTNVLVNAAYDFAFTTTGYPAPTFTVSGGSLPPGLALSSAGVLSGTPTQTGTFSAVITASNGIVPSQSVTVTINVLGASTAPILSGGAPPDNATLTIPYSYQFPVKGYPAPTFTLASGNLPPGITLSSAGLLAGTPTQAGTFSGTISAGNGVNPNATQAFSITVSSAAAPAISNGPPPTTILLGSTYNFAYTATGSPIPTFAIAAGSLPPGITLNASGTLSGTPTKTGTYTGTVSASSSISPAATQAFSITVQQAPGIANGPPPATALGGGTYAFAFQVTGFPVPTFSVTAGSLPPGITLTSAGVMSGSPTTPGIYTGTITASNGVSPSASQDFSITVQTPIAPSITNGPATATVLLGATYSFAYTAAGFPTPTFSLAAGTLPQGLTLSTAGVLSGIPTQTGTFSGTIQAGNGVNPVATQAFTIAVQQGPTIASAALSAVIAVNSSFSYAYQWTGYPAPTFTVTSGALPSGLTLTTAGILSGTPTALGTYTGVVTAANAGGSTTQAFSVKVVAQSSLTLTVNLPAAVNEGDADGQGTVYASTTPASALTVTLTSSNTGALTVPVTVTIPAGQNSATFAYTIIDNLNVFGPETTVVTSHVSGWTDGTEQVGITDNKTTDNWSSYGNGPAHAGVYPGTLLGSAYQLAWAANIPSGIDALQPVVVAKGLVYVSNSPYFSAANLTALNATTGAQVWQYNFPDCYPLDPPTYYKGHVYAETGLVTSGGTSSIYSLNAATGAFNWMLAYPTQGVGYYGPTINQSAGIWVGGGEYGGLYGYTFAGAQKAVVAEPQEDQWTPTYYNGTIYSWVMTAGLGTGTFQAVNPSTGSVLWSATEPGTEYVYDMNCAAPIVNNVAFLNGQTDLTALNVSTHAVVWHITGTFVGTPAVSNGFVYVISGSKLKILNAATGATVSSLETLDTGLSGQPIVASDSVLVSSSTATYLFNLQTGVLVQTLPYGGPASIAGGTIYLAGNDGNIRAFKPVAAGFNIAANGSGGLSSYGYTATGQDLNVTLNSVPTPGEVLTVINNTSSSPISGAFNNLSNGGTINLIYNGTTYLFTGNYSGGDGNDLTLTFTSAPAQAPSLTDGPPPAVIAVNNAYNFSYFASGYPAPTFSVTAGQLPPGISLSSTGVLSGTPTTVGTYTGTITATNATSISSQNFSIAVQSGLALTLTLPATVNESDADGQGDLTLNAVAASDLTVTLASSNTGAITVPTTVTIPAGQSSIAVPYTIIDNLAVYGTQTATVAAQATGYTSASGDISVTDNKTTDNWSSFGNGQAHTGVYLGPLLGGTYTQAWSTALAPSSNPLNQVVVARGNVYATYGTYFGIGGVTALNALTGSQIWQYNYNASGNRYYGINPPTIYKGNVYVQQGQGLTASYTQTVSPRLWSFDAATGHVNWTTAFDAQWQTYLAPTVYQSAGIMVDAGEGDGLYSFGFDGSLNFSDTEPQFDEWTPSYYNNTIYTWVGTSNNSATAGYFEAINPTTGALLWTVDAPFYWLGYDMNCAAPVSDNLSFLNGNGTLTAVNLATPAIAWTISGQFIGTPAVSNGVVYAISGTKVEALDAPTGTVLGSFETLDTGLTGQPVIATDSLVVSSATATYLFDLQTGSLAQTIPFGGPVSVAGGTLYIAGPDGTLRAYRSSAENFSLATTSTTGITAYGFNATGQTLNVDLNFIPTVGTVLTVVNNTSPDPITGTFTNVPNGGTVQLTYNGASHFGTGGASALTSGAVYTFTANYSGGNGNDLTLVYTASDAGAPSITSGTPPATVAFGQAYSFTYSATTSVVNNAAPAFSIVSGSLPPGITLTSAGALSGTPTRPGTYTGSVQVTSGSVPGATQTFTISVVASYSQWATYFQVNGGPSDTPRSDGVPNLLKYLYDIDPSVALTPTAAAALPTLGVDSTTVPGTTCLTLVFRNSAAATGLSVGVQSSSDLQTWTPVTPEINQQVGTDSSTGDPKWEIGVPLSGAAKQFIRLSVPPPLTP